MNINLKRISTTLLVAMALTAPQLGHASVMDAEDDSSSDVSNSQTSSLKDDKGKHEEVESHDNSNQIPPATQDSGDKKNKEYLENLTLAANGHISQLPGDVLAEIFTCTAHNGVGLDTLRAVCQQWRQVVNQHFLVKQADGVIKIGPRVSAFYGLNGDSSDAERQGVHQWLSGKVTKKLDDGTDVPVFNFSHYPFGGTFVHEGLVLTNSPLCTFAEIPGTQDFVVGALWHGQAIRLVAGNPNHPLAPIMDDWDGENCPFWPILSATRLEKGLWILLFNVIFPHRNISKEFTPTFCWLRRELNASHA